ncbi:MAG: GNAT family N-acetyltransferase [Balneolaceae bacterium]
MKSPITVRESKSEDIETLVQFNIALASETESKHLDPERVTSGVKSLFKKPEFGFYLVAETESRVVGSLMITYEWSDWRNGLFWWIQSVYVLPGYRRRGVYSAMHKFIRKLAEEHPDACGIRLYVENENRAAQNTYHQLGMKETYYKMFEAEL